jgi:son of sevenless-like protein
MYAAQSSTATVTMNQMAVDRRPNASFCRAIYDYQASDSSSLSFQKNDILEVVNRLESGWWDGFLGEVRGWFPSNYVAIISDEEAEEILYGSHTSLQTRGAPSNHGSDTTKNGIVGEGSHPEDNWLHGDIDRSVSNDNTSRPPNAHDPTTRPNDFWLPEVTPNGQVIVPLFCCIFNIDIHLPQVFYVNTQTGEKSRDLPHEVGNSIIDTELTGLSSSQSTSHAGTKAGVGFRVPESNLAGFGVPHHTETPEPWVRKLGDDGMTYYYVNKTNGETRWSLPEPEIDITPTNERPSELPPDRAVRKHPGTATSPTHRHNRISKRNTATLPARQRSGSATSGIRPLPRINAANRAVEVHSDDSEIYPINRERSGSVSSTEGSLSGDSGPLSYGKKSSSPDDLDSSSEPESAPEPESVPEMSSTERLAQLLQNSLAPSPAELITDLSDTARDTVREVLNNIQLDDPDPLPDEATMDELIRSVVLAVRNLVYVAAVSPPQIPSNVLPRVARERRHTTASQNLLKTPQRKVTATLAKLVLSARAMQYNSGAHASNTPSRIKYDAEELDRCIVAFVQEVQRCVQLQVHGVTGLKRLRGYFSTSNIGLVLVGAGVAGSWKGLGWVALDENEEAPGKILGVEVVTELDTFADQVDEKYNAFHGALMFPTGKRSLSSSFWPFLILSV